MAAIATVVTIGETIINLIGVYEEMKAQRQAEANLEDDKIIADLDSRILNKTTDMDVADKDASEDVAIAQADPQAGKKPPPKPRKHK